MFLGFYCMISFERYCNASVRRVDWILSLSARPAIVRASLRMRFIDRYWRIKKCRSSFVWGMAQVFLLKAGFTGVHLRRDGIYTRISDIFPAGQILVVLWWLTVQKFIGGSAGMNQTTTHFPADAQIYIQYHVVVIRFPYQQAINVSLNIPDILWRF